MSKETDPKNQVNLNALYQEIILDHHRDPRNFGELSHSTCSAEGFNPMCGDRVRVELEIDQDGKALLDQKFSGEGCSICMASASMMTEELEGEKLETALEKVKTFRQVMQGGAQDKIEGDLEALEGVKKFPVRIKCALLPWTTLKEAIEGCPLIKGLSNKKEGE